MRPSLIVNRTIDSAIAAYRAAGVDPREVLVSNDARLLDAAVLDNRPAVATQPGIAGSLTSIDVIIGATSDIAHSVHEALSAIDQGKHFISMGGEADGAFGCLLAARAEAAGVIYSNADGDQPGVLMRIAEYCATLGFEVVAAINCKGFMDVSATPDSIADWAARQNTSRRMTCAFTDGTKMNLEQTIVSNATGLVPLRRGMTGVRTDLAHAIGDFEAAGLLSSRGIVDYTIGGDFGSGVFVIARSEDPQFAQPYLQYLKMGDGPNYLFFRPNHLCHMETPLSAAEAVIYGEPTVRQRRAPVAHTVAVAKRDLCADAVLDGVGGYNQYGEIDTAERAEGLLPIGLTDGVRITRFVKRGDPISLDCVELDDRSPLTRLWQEQQRL
jgi:predicted homoserine dehydrogenase-like protein